MLVLAICLWFAARQDFRLIGAAGVGASRSVEGGFKLGNRGHHGGLVSLDGLLDGGIPGLGQLLELRANFVYLLHAGLAALPCGRDRGLELGADCRRRGAGRT